MNNPSFVEDAYFNLCLETGEAGGKMVKLLFSIDGTQDH